MKNRIVKLFSILLIIPFLIKYYRKYKKRNELRKSVLADGTTQYFETAKNIADSISKSKTLYKELITKIHPDKFHDKDKLIATELSTKVTNAKRNYNQLLIIKDEIDYFLRSRT
jgi:hypothetical protein